MRRAALTLFLALSALACQSTHKVRVVAVDNGQRAELLAAVAALEGRWQMPGAEGQGPQIVEFKVSSNGSVVREVMFPGTPSEMTNMYSLDGNTLLMTHYCASGNQPHMRADAYKDGQLAFEFDSVSDLKAPDEVFMGSMTLVVVDADHIEQHWSAHSGEQVDHMAVFALTREE